LPKNQVGLNIEEKFHKPKITGRKVAGLATIHAATVRLHIKMILTDTQIKEICDEIEQQWDYHLMTRAVFYSKFSEADDYYESPVFYQHNGFDFKIRLPKNKSDRWENAAKGIGTWLNQNFVIRLYGILDSKKIRSIKDKPDIIKLIEILRQNVGAHSSGRKVSKKSELKKATNLINSLFNQNINIQEIDSFILSVDTVLEPMKNQVINYIKSLQKE